MYIYMYIYGKKTHILYLKWQIWQSIYIINKYDNIYIYKYDKYTNMAIYIYIYILYIYVYMYIYVYIIYTTFRQPQSVIALVTITTLQNYFSFVPLFINHD